MKNLLLAMPLLVTPLLAPAAEASALPMTQSSHYVDAGGQSLPGYEAAWEELRPFFREAAPPRILVRFATNEFGTSQFDPLRQEVILNSTLRNDEAALLSVLHHESSHLALYRLTGTHSATDGFRFLDEGFATYLKEKFKKSLDAYRAKALRVAAQKIAIHDADLQKMQVWKEYFGGPGANRWFAYDVGASFIFFLLERAGEETLRAFFADIAHTGSFSRSLSTLYGVSVADADTQWKEWVNRNVPPETVTPPTIVSWNPANGARDVSPALKEIEVRFSLDMDSDICVITSCNDGICYENAKWRDARTLVIPAVPALVPNHEYRLGLGSVPYDCNLRSKDGVPLPVTEWTFTTSSASEERK